MRRTASVLSVAALASAMAGFAASAAFADPVAEVSPSTGSPGGSVTVSVSCESTGGKAPDTIDATSQAFEEGTVQLQRVPGNDDKASGTAYRGTARIASAADLEGTGSEHVGPDVGGSESGGLEDIGPEHAGEGEAPEGVGPESVGPESVGPDDIGPETVPDYGGSEHGAPQDTGPAAAGGNSTWTVEGDCPAAHGGKGKPWSATFHVGRSDGGGSTKPCGQSHAGSCDHDRPCTEQHDDSCGGGAVQHGVEAGAGGAFTDSVPALVAGGALIAAALGGAGYRLWLRRSAAGGRTAV